MRVLFVFRNNEWLGVEYLSSMLKQAGHTTDLVYDPGMGDMEFHIGGLEKLIRSRVRRNMLQKARKFSPDLIAFSCVTNLYSWVSEMAAIFKKELGVPVIAGGMHPTFFPEVVISNPNIDMICRGEGEHALLELVNKMEKGEDYFGVRNMWFKDGGRIVRNELRPLVEDLDTLPLPDKDLFYQYRCFSDRVYVITARGCPYDCSYCFNHCMKELYRDKGTYVRRRSAESVIGELREYKQKYRMKQVFFFDDNFALDIAWLRRFVPAYKKEIALPFKCLARADSLSEEAVALLKDAGCRCVDMGVESGSDKVRNEIMGRRMSRSMILEAGSFVKRAGIELNALNIVGCPGEDLEDMAETVAINRELRPDGAIACTLYPFPGTRIAKMAEEYGCLDAEVMGRIERGEGSFRGETLLKHPFRKEVQQYHVFLPVLIKFPKSMERFILHLPQWRVFRFISIFFSYNVRYLFIRIREQLQATWYAVARQG